MSRLIIPYNFFILIFCVGTALLMFASSHRVDTGFLIANTSSLVVFPLTAYFLNRVYSEGKQPVLTITLLVLTACILLYYIRDFMFNSVDGISTIILFPLVVLLLSILFIVNIFLKSKA